MANNNNTKVLNVPNLRFLGFTDDWKKYQLKELCKMLSGGTPALDNQKFWNGAIPFISASAMHFNYITDSELHLTKEGLAHGSKLLGKNNLLLLVRGSMLWKHIPICYNLIDVAFNQDVKGIILNNQADSLFMLYWFEAHEKRIKYMVTGTGIGAGKLDTEDLLSMNVLLPHLNEQNKISGLLRLLDERIATQIRIIDKMQSLIKGLAVALTTKGKPNIAISQCLECHSSTLQESEVLSNGLYKVFGANGLVGYINTAQMNGDAILVIKDGSGVGTVSYAQGKFSVIGTLNYLTAIGNIDLRYLYFALSVFNFQPYKTGMAIPHIYFKDYGKAKIYCPPLTEQKRVANMLGTMVSKLFLSQELLASFNLQKRYLLGQMFI